MKGNKKRKYLRGGNLIPRKWKRLERFFSIACGQWADTSLGGEKEIKVPEVGA